MITMSQTKSANYLFIVAVLKSMREGGVITLAEYERAKRYHQPRALSQNAGRTRQADEPGAKFHQNGYHIHRKILPVRTIQCDDLRRMRKSI